MQMCHKRSCVARHLLMVAVAPERAQMLLFISQLFSFCYHVELVNWHSVLEGRFNAAVSLNAIRNWLKYEMCFYSLI